MADIRQEMRDAPYCAVFVYGKGRTPLEVAVAAREVKRGDLLLRSESNWRSSARSAEGREVVNSAEVSKAPRQLHTFAMLTLVIYAIHVLAGVPVDALVATVFAAATTHFIGKDDER